MLGHLTAAVLERYLIGEDFLNLLSPDIPGFEMGKRKRVLEEREISVLKGGVVGNLSVPAQNNQHF